MAGRPYDRTAGDGSNGTEPPPELRDRLTQPRALLATLAAALEAGDVLRALGDCEQLRALLWALATTPVPPPRYLTLDEAAEVLRCTHRDALALTRKPDG